MSKKKHSYSPRLVKDNYSYTVEQIADLLKINVATVHRWIKDEGLARIPKMRPFLIHSSALKIFLKNKKSTRKKPCELNQVFCFKCKVPCIPKIGTGKIQKQANGAIKFQAQCSVCNTNINKAIKHANWSINHPLFVYMGDAIKQHNRKQRTHLKCQLQGGKQLCMNLTL